MIVNFKIDFDQLNRFLKKIVFKKMYLNKLKYRILFLIQILKQNYKKLNSKINNNKTNFLIVYIIKIYFSKTNTFTQIINSLGMLKIFCSSGNLFYKGKNKIARIAVLQKMTYFLINKLDKLKNKIIILHLKNIGFKKIWIIKKFGKKTIVKTVVGFNLYSHNGCRKKKICRKKRKQIKEIAKWLRQQTVNLLYF